jgi:hypothetical protein
MNSLIYEFTKNITEAVYHPYFYLINRNLGSNPDEQVFCLWRNWNTLQGDMNSRLQFKNNMSEAVVRDTS